MSDPSSGSGARPEPGDLADGDTTRRLPPEDETRRVGPADTPEGRPRRGEADAPDGTRRVEPPADDAPDETRRVDDRAPPPERAPARQRAGDRRGGFLERFGDRDLPVAIGAGVVLVAVFLATVLLSRVAFTVLVAALVLVGAAETGRELRRLGVQVSVPVLVVSGVVVLVGAHQAGHAGQAVGLVTLFVGAVVWELTDRDRHDVVRRVGATVLLGLWVPFLGSYAVLLHARESGWAAVIATVAAAIVADVGAYFVGNRFGERKLAPTVSPGKSWEGMLGGLALAVAVAVATYPLLGSPRLFTPGTAALFAAIVAGAGVVGDLAESMLKRDLGVKDFGGVIPGHGGVLDRVDSILFALPVGYYLLDVLGR